MNELVLNKLRKVTLTKAGTLKYGASGLSPSAIISKIEGELDCHLSDGDYKEALAYLEDKANEKPDSDGKFVLTIDKVEEVLKELGIEYNFLSCKWLKNRHPKGESEVVNNIDMFFRTCQGMSVSTDHIKNCIKGFKDEAKDKTMDEADKRMAYNPHVQYRPVAEHIYETLKVKNASLDAFILALRQWCWQIKRRWYGESCGNQLVINFYTPNQGVGKTELTQDICTSLLPKTFCSAVTLENIFDTSRCYNLLTELFIARLDEWSIGGETTENNGKMTVDQLNLFKSIITDNDTRKVRAMGGDTTLEVNTNLSFIGSSNSHFYASFPRAEECRRFVEFEVGKNNTDMNEAEYKEFRDYVKENFILIMQSVDEGNEFGYFKTAEYPTATEELKQLQAGYVKAMEANDSVISYIEESKADDNYGLNRELYDWKSMYADFTEKCLAKGFSRMYIPQFQSFKGRVCIYLGLDSNKATIEEVVVKLDKTSNASKTDESPF